MKPSKPFANGTEYTNWMGYFCERCNKYKIGDDGLPLPNNCKTELAELEDWIDTIEDAIQTEYDMVDYASRTQPVSGLSTYRVKCNKRIKELEDIHERGIRKANGSDICAGSKGRLRYGGI